MRRIVVVAAACLMAACGTADPEGLDDVEPRPHDAETEVIFGCTADADCDDGNGCTVDVCRADGSCESTPQAGADCDDGNACTLDDSCNGDGVCVGAEALNCDDGNVCTGDECDPKTGCQHLDLDGQEECDGSDCTDGDQCQAGECMSGEMVLCYDANPDDCTFVTCNNESGLCEMVQHEPEGHPCKDGNPCTDDDKCDAGGLCLPGSAHECTAQHPCKKAWCNETAKEGTNPCVLEWKQEGVGCNDGDACTDDDMCVPAGEDAPDLQCAGEPIDCDDDNPCTLNSCNEETGCGFEDKADNTPCQLPPQYCGEKGKCLNGECGADDVVVCDDNVACTVDVCDAGECQHQPDDTPCEDGNVCTADTCGVVGGCDHAPDKTLGEACCEEDSDCDDGNVCTEDVCGNDFHCLNSALSGPDCDDGLFCTVDDACVDGFCTGDANACLDGIMCTADTCDEEQDLCLHQPVEGACDDQIACTTDTCDPEKGCQFVPDDGTCDDQNVCTSDSCNAETGCVFTPLGGEVDGTACCLADDEECDDNKQCTVDACNLTSHHCISLDKDDDAPCSDGLKCTDDSCQAGQCTSTAKVCDDNIGCTTDSCNEDEGCVYTPDDGACADSNDCTTEACDEIQGCQYVNLDSDDCDDGNNATVDDFCDEDTCTGLPDPDGDGVANSGYDFVGPCTGGEFEGCNDNCPDVPNADQADADANGIGDVCDGPHAGLDLFEPCADISPAYKGGQCDAGGAAYDDHASSWQRTDEPFELPLVNGILNASVLGYWKLDGDAEDWGQTGHDGSFLGAPVPDTGASGAPDGALAFDGKGDGIVVPGSQDLGIGLTELTVSAWVHPTKSQASTFIVEKEHTQNNDASYSLAFYENDGQPHYAAAVKTDLSGGIGVKHVAAVGKWSLVTLVFDGESLSLYVNGRLAERTEAKGKIFAGGEKKELSIAYRNHGGGPSYHFEGSLDEVLIFNRVLSPYEIEAYYHSRKPYGYGLALDCQDDLDDIRVTERAQGDPPEEIVHEVLGPRTHSDTLCPPGADPSTFPSRDDLCGVSAWWKFDGDGQDASGNGHHGSVTEGVAALGPFGPGSGSLEFDGTGYVQTPLTPVVKQGDSITLEAWALVEAGAQGSMDLMGLERSNHQELRLIQSPSGVCLSFRDDSWVAPKACASVSLADGSWHHVAGVRDASTDKLMVYVDGLLLGEGADTTTASMNESATRELCLAGDNNSSQGVISRFKGRLAEVLVHDVAKSPDYIYRRANPGLPSVRFLVDTEPEPNPEGTFGYKSYALTWGDPDAEYQAPLVPDANDDNDGSPCVGLLSRCSGYGGWWRLNEGRGAVAADSSANGRLGMILGQPLWAGAIEGVGLLFDGLDDFVEVFDISGLNLDKFTIEACVSPENLAAADHAVVNKGGEAAAYRVEISNSDVGHVYFDAGEHLESGQGLAAGAWEPVAATYDGTEQKVWLHYVEDGVMAAGAPVDKDGSLYLGSHGGYGYFEGILDSVRIMNRALEPDQLLHHPLTRAWGLDYLCPASCDGKECGDDGCGGSCGECAGEEECVQGQCLSVQVYQDNGEEALNGTNPNSGDSLTNGGWSANNGPAESISYTSEQAHEGNLGLKTYGNNGAGAHFTFDEVTETVVADVWYLTGSGSGADRFIVSGAGGSVAIMTQGFCGSSGPFMYGFSDPGGGSGSSIAIPGAPSYQANKWYHFTIAVGGMSVTLTVADGQASGTIDFALNASIPLDTVKFTVDCCGGCSHAAYWDDLAVEILL